MVISERDLVAGFARAMHVGDATLFIGAGISQGAGLPGWNGLIGGARASAQVPESIADAPLAAEYIALVRGEGWLDGEIRKVIDVEIGPTATQRTLAALRVRDYWTTNYDNLIEAALGERSSAFQRIVDESDYASNPAASGSGTKRVTKMHGSLTLGRPGELQWQRPPVITRSHFEQYEAQHPITWSRLRATWLTNSMLFLGFSFDDPNLNLLLRLSRSLPTGVDVPQHYAVFSKKADRTDDRLQQLRIMDLERSGVSVHEIDSHNALDPLLGRLEVRSRPPTLFVSGSFKKEDETARRLAETIAVALDSMPDPEFGVVSFGGDAGQVVSKAYRDAMSPATYRPEKIKFYFRKARPGSRESIPIEHRVGTAIFTELDIEEMRQLVFPGVRALLLVGGGSRTSEEVALARTFAIPVIPVAASGGAAKELWESSSPEALGLDDPNVETLWKQLDSTQIALAANAAVQAVRNAMFA